AFDGSTDEEFAKLISKGCRSDVIVLTAGATGCYVYAEGEVQFIKRYATQVVGTAEAGEAISAADVRAYVRHHDPLRAADIANKLGAFVAGSRGPIPDYSPEIKKALGINT